MKRFFFIAIFFLASPAWAATYWVSPAVHQSECKSAGTPWACCTGNGQGCVGAGNSCSESSPCATIATGIDKLSSGSPGHCSNNGSKQCWVDRQCGAGNACNNPAPTGDTLNVMPGKYLECAADNVCGTSTASILLKDKAGARVQRAPGTSVRPLIQPACSGGRIPGVKIYNSAGATVSGIKSFSEKRAGIGHGFNVCNSTGSTISDSVFQTERDDNYTMSYISEIRQSDYFTIDRTEVYQGPVNRYCTGPGKPFSCCNGNPGTGCLDDQCAIKPSGDRLLNVSDSDNVVIGPGNYFHHIDQIMDYFRSRDLVVKRNLFQHLAEHGITSSTGASGLLVENNVVIGDKNCTGCKTGVGNSCGTCRNAAEHFGCWKDLRFVDHYECKKSATRVCTVRNNTFIGFGYMGAGGALWRNYAQDNAQLGACSEPAGQKENCEQGTIVSNNIVYKISQPAHPSKSWAIVFENRPVDTDTTNADIDGNYYAGPLSAIGVCRVTPGYPIPEIDIYTPAEFAGWKQAAACNTPDSNKGTYDPNPNDSAYFVRYLENNSADDYKPPAGAPYLGQGYGNPGSVHCASEDFDGNPRSGICTPGAFAGPGGTTGPDLTPPAEPSGLQVND